MHKQPGDLEEILKKYDITDHDMVLTLIDQVRSRANGNPKMFAELLDVELAGLTQATREAILNKIEKETDAGIIRSILNEMIQTLEGSIYIGVTQSGTTKDTNAAIDRAHAKGAYTTAIVNRVNSLITTEITGKPMYTGKGQQVEMAVASTKMAYMMMISGAILAVHIGKTLGTLSDEEVLTWTQAILDIPQQMKTILNRYGLRNVEQKMEPVPIKEGNAILEAAQQTYNHKGFLVFGPGINEFTAKEVRMKELEEVQSLAIDDEADQGKHGDIVLAEQGLPVVYLINNSMKAYRRTLQNLGEYFARGVYLIAVATEGDPEPMITNNSSVIIRVPKTIEALTPILNVVSLHLLSYYRAMEIRDRHLSIEKERRAIETTLAQQGNDTELKETLNTACANCLEKILKGEFNLLKPSDAVRLSLLLQLAAGWTNSDQIKKVLAGLKTGSFSNLEQLAEGKIKVKVSHPITGKAIIDQTTGNQAIVEEDLLKHLLRMLGVAERYIERTIDQLRHAAKTVVV